MNESIRMCINRIQIHKIKTQICKYRISRIFMETCIIYVDLYNNYSGVYKNKIKNILKFMEFLDDNIDIWLNDKMYKKIKYHIMNLLAVYVDSPIGIQFIEYQLKFGFLCQGKMGVGEKCRNKKLGGGGDLCIIHQRIDDIKKSEIRRSLSLIPDLQNIVLGYIV